MLLFECDDLRMATCGEFRLFWISELGEYANALEAIVGYLEIRDYEDGDANALPSSMYVVSDVGSDE